MEAKTFYYDGVGNRTQEISTPPGGSATTSTLGYPVDSNRVVDITEGTQTVRSFGYDAVGNMTSDNRLGSTYAYTYNDAGRLKTVSYEGNLRGTYEYNGRSQLSIRTITNMGAGIDGTIHTVPSLWGDIIVEADATGQTLREYIWIPEVVSLPH